MRNKINQAARVLAELFIAEAAWTAFAGKLPPSDLAMARERAMVLVERHHKRTHGKNLLTKYTDGEGAR